MSWLKVLLLLAQLTLNLSRALRERKLVAEAEVKGAEKAMEQVNARLRKAIDARGAPAPAGVRDRYQRD